MTDEEQRLAWIRWLEYYWISDSRYWTDEQKQKAEATKRETIGRLRALPAPSDPTLRLRQIDAIDPGLGVAWGSLVGF